MLGLNIGHLSEEKQKEILERIDIRRKEHEKQREIDTARRTNEKSNFEWAAEKNVVYKILDARFGYIFMAGWKAPKFENKEEVIPVTIAICAPQDDFSPRIGKKVINRRLIEEKYLTTLTVKSSRIKSLDAEKNRDYDFERKKIGALVEMAIESAILYGHNLLPNNMYNKAIQTGSFGQARNTF